MVYVASRSFAGGRPATRRAALAGVVGQACLDRRQRAHVLVAVALTASR
jgi:hypothetical protein